MSIAMWTYILVGLSFGLYIGIAIWSRAVSTKDFYIAGGGVSPLVNGMATAADWMSAASFISMAGLLAFGGYDASVYLMGWTGGYVLLALLLAPYLRKFGKFTVPDFIGDRYYSQQARILAVVCAIFISFTYVAGQMRGVGIVFARFLDVSIELGVVLGMIIVLFYAVLGGMKGITYTQVAQYCVLMCAYMIPAIFISFQLTGSVIPQLGFIGENTAGEPLLPKLNGMLTELGFAAYTDGSKAKIDLFFITFALMAGTAGLPHVIIRFFTVPKVRDARKSAAYALAFISILYTTAPVLGALGMYNTIESISERKMDDLPSWVSSWESTKLIGVEDKNGDGRVQFVKDAAANELYIDKDILVMANPEIANLPNWLVALVAAGALAAALSTAAGLLLVISMAISRDLLKNVLRPDISEKSELRAARIAAACAVVCAGYFGINPPGFVAEVVAFAFGLAAASFFPAILMGIFSKRINKEGAIAGMTVGLVFTICYIVYFKFINPESNALWFGISPEGIGTLGMLFNFVVSVVVSYLSPPPPAHIQELVETIRIPSGAGEAHSH